MKIKECYVSYNGISCISNINSLNDFKDIEFKSIINNKNTINNLVNKNNILLYLTLRVSEFIIKDFIENRFDLLDCNYVKTNLLPNIIFS
tara:strand:- start:41 stop:310 length:270 start_codon:yes stop_codon:yes gene_type:complete